MITYLAELTAYDPALLGTRVLRYSLGSGYTTGPGDIPANEHYAPQIAQPAMLRRQAFEERKSSGRSRQGYGQFVLLNPDGALDDLLTYSIDGRDIRILRGDSDGAYADFVEVLVGRMHHLEGDITVSIRDRQAEIAALELQPTKYAGDNVLPDGLEGGDDLAGKPKPFCIGTVRNIAPVLVNTSRLIYQMHDGPVVNDATYPVRVYVRGVELVQGADYIGQFDMETNAPAAGQYRVWPDGGYFRLASTADGQVTADVTEALPASRMAGNTMEMLLLRAGYTVADYDPNLPVTGDAQSHIGFWTADEAQLADVFDKLAHSIGAWWGANRLGVFELVILTDPSGGVAVQSFDQNSMLRAPRRVTPKDDVVPVQRYTIRHNRNFTVQKTDVAASVTAARRVEIGEEWLAISRTDPAVASIHPLAGHHTDDSLLIDAGFTGAECDRRLALRSVQREMYEVVVSLDDDTIELDLGHIINVSHPRFGLSAGRNFVILGANPDAAKDELTLTVWG